MASRHDLDIVVLHVCSADLGRVPTDPGNAQIGDLLHHPLDHDAILLQVWHMRLHSAAQLLQLAGSRHLWAGLHDALHLLLPPVYVLLSLLGLPRTHTPSCVRSGDHALSTCQAA